MRIKSLKYQVTSSLTMTSGVDWKCSSTKQSVRRDDKPYKLCTNVVEDGELWKWKLMFTRSSRGVYEPPPAMRLFE